jgi:hypothetical protein
MAHPSAFSSGYNDKPFIFMELSPNAQLPMKIFKAFRIFLVASSPPRQKVIGHYSVDIPRSKLKSKRCP